MSAGLTMTDTPTVLIIDDNRPLADGFASALAEEYKVHTAYTGRQAREAFHDGIDVVLLDRRLPDVPGDELLTEFRENDADCRVAVVSAELGSADLDCDLALSKPVGGIDTLRQTVSDLVDGNVSR